MYVGMITENTGVEHCPATITLEPKLSKCASGCGRQPFRKMEAQRAEYNPVMRRSSLARRREIGVRFSQFFHDSMSEGWIVLPSDPRHLKTCLADRAEPRRCQPIGLTQKFLQVALDLQSSSMHFGDVPPTNSLVAPLPINRTTGGVICKFLTSDE